jgi:purine nucleosidase
MKKKIILDCDPGIDDSLAIALLCASNEIDLRGVTVTHGNVPVSQTLENALALLSFLGRDIEVYAGATRPLIRSPIDASNVHGNNGLGGVQLPSHKRKANAKGAVEFIINEVMANPGEISLFGIGPLTNIALALRIEPRLADATAEIVIMGGAIGEGNTTPASEFNLYADPHAARIVFESGRLTTMFGLDVTHKALATAERLAPLKHMDNKVADLILSFLDSYRGFYVDVYGWKSPAIHDMCTIAWAIDPSLFQTRKMRMEVDTNEGLNLGRTVGDSLLRNTDAALVDVALDVDADGLFALFAERIARY